MIARPRQAARRSPDRDIEPPRGGNDMRTTRVNHLIALATVAVAVAAAPDPGASAHPGHGTSSKAAVEASRERRLEFEAPTPGTYRLPVIKPAADGTVLDARGAERRLHELM